MPRRARLDAPGTLHHVIVRGIEKRRIVNDVADRKNFVKRLAGEGVMKGSNLLLALIYFFLYPRHLVSELLIF